MVIGEALAAAGFEVVVVNDAIDAMREVKGRDDICAVVTDIRMSASDGLALAHKVHRDKPGIGIVLISGVFEPSEGARPAGSRFLLKPCRVARIVEAVGDVLRGRQAPLP
jgi:DNA-binding NtrC family response regulator